MLSARLVRLIEEHAEPLTAALSKDVQSNPRTRAFHGVSRDQLQKRAYEVYRHLGEWLGHRMNEKIEASYSELGRRAHAEGVPLEDVLYALMLVKYHLRDYVHSAGLLDTAVELYQQLELYRLVGNFFDEAMYWAATGYERAATRHGESRAERQKESRAAEHVA